MRDWTILTFEVIATFCVWAADRLEATRGR